MTKNIYVVTKSYKNYRDSKIQAFKTEADARESFIDTLCEYYSRQGYVIDKDKDEYGRSFGMCVEDGCYVDYGYILRIRSIPLL